MQRDGARGSLRPGSVLLRYARRAGRGGDLVELTAAALDELAELTGETVNVAVAGPAGVEHLAQRDSRFFLGSVELDRTAGAVPRRRERQGLPRLRRGEAAARRARSSSPSTPSSTAARLEASSRRSGQRGWATAVEELEPGLLAVAAPVRDAHGDVIAALSVSAPTVRLPAERLATLGPLVAAAAARVPTGV